jgi:hypothetical protein
MGGYFLIVLSLWADTFLNVLSLWVDTFLMYFLYG